MKCQIQREAHKIQSMKQCQIAREIEIDRRSMRNFRASLYIIRKRKSGLKMSY